MGEGEALGMAWISWLICLAGMSCAFFRREVVTDRFILPVTALISELISINRLLHYYYRQKAAGLEAYLL